MCVRERSSIYCGISCVGESSFDNIFASQNIILSIFMNCVNVFLFFFKRPVESGCNKSLLETSVYYLLYNE